MQILLNKLNYISGSRLRNGSLSKHLYSWTLTNNGKAMNQHKIDQEKKSARKLNIHLYIFRLPQKVTAMMLFIQAHIFGMFVAYFQTCADGWIVQLDIHTTLMSLYSLWCEECPYLFSGNINPNSKPAIQEKNFSIIKLISSPKNDICHVIVKLLIIFQISTLFYS